MLKNVNVEVVHSIERYAVDVKNKFIDIEIATGAIVEGKFISDKRSLIKHNIKNIPDKQLQQIDTLTVDANGQVTLSLMPIDSNPIELDGVAQDHITGQLVACAEYSEGDVVTVKYYHNKQGRNWFNEAAEYRQVDHPECIGMNDYEYNSHRVWSVLTEMGLVTGDII